MGQTDDVLAQIRQWRFKAMNDNKLAPETPADVLHTHVTNHIQMPDTQKFDNESFIDEVTAHPNLGSNSIADMYNHAMAHNSESALPATGEAGTGNISNTSTANLLKHPNMPAHLKADFVGKTYHPDNVHSDLHQELADQGVVPEAHLRNMSEAVLGQGQSPHTYKQIAPDYFLGHFSKRAQQDPEGLDEASQEAHTHESNLGFQGLIASTKHTPESLDQTIQAFMGNKHARPSGRSDNRRLLSELVSERSDLSKDQLNRIHQYAEANDKGEDDRHRDTVPEEVLKHKNADPALLAKYATGKDVRSEALSHPNLPKESINAFIKRSKDPNSWKERSDVQSLLENPNITKAHVKALTLKGSEDALHHELADEGDVRAVWNASDKSTQQAKNILGAQRVPPDVLKEIVNHKNQDVAVQALGHKNADMDVVQEGLKRKAKGVQDEARKHPLVADQQVREGLQSGKVSIAKAYADPAYKSRFDNMPPADQEKVFQAAHDKLKGSDLEDLAKKNKHGSDEVIYNKFKLASDPRAPEAIREHHAKDLADMFTDKLPKNTEPNHNNYHILSENHKSDDGRILRAVSDLASGGNKDAQQAILNNPGVLQGIKSHVDLNKAPGDFLEAIFQKRVEHQQNGETVFDYAGRPQQFDAHASLLSPLFSSPNLPERTFHEIATNRDLMDKLGQGDQFQRYDELPEDQQNAKYGPILDTGGPEAAKSVLKASAPKESWDRAFDSIDPGEKLTFLNDNISHVKEHRPDVFKNTALGVYNTTAVGSSKAQHRAIEAMNAESSEDVNTLKKIISTPQEMAGSVDDDNLKSSIPVEIAEKDYSLADHAFAAGRPELGYHLVAKRAQQLIEDIGYPYSHDSESKKAAQQEKVGSAMADISAKVETMPMIEGASDNPIASKWSELINNSKAGYDDDSFFKKLKERGGNLDFLADMPGQAGQQLKRQAMEKNLISDNKLNEIASTGTAKDITNVANPKKRMEMFNAFLQNPNIQGSDIAHLADRLDQTYLNPEAHQRGRRQSMSSETLNQFNSSLNRLIDLASEKSPDSLASLITNAMRAPSKSDELTQTDKSAIINSLNQHITSRPYASDADKNKAMYQVYKALKTRGDNDSSKMQKTIESNAFKSNDLDTVVEMAENRHLSQDGIAKLSKIAAQPDTLSATQISALSTQLDSYSSPEAVLGMTKAFDSKIAEMQANNPKANIAAVKNKFLSSLSQTFNPYETTAGDKTKNDFVINYNRKAALDPHTAPKANSNLLHISGQLASKDLDKAMNIYTSLPDDATKFDSDKAFYTELPSEMINDPRFVEGSASGWKLQKLAASAESLTGANASVLTGRAISEAGATLNKTDLMTSFENNPFVQSDDTIKLARSMSENDFNKLIKGDDSNTMEGNILFAAHARLSDLDAMIKDPNLVSPGAPFMGFEHQNKIAYNMQALAHVVQNAKFAEDTSLLKDKLVKTSEIIHKIHENSMHLATNMIAEINRTGYTTDIGMNAGYLLDTAYTLSNTGLALDRADSIKILEMVNAHRNIQKAADLDASSKAHFDTIKNVVEKAENFEDQDWSETFKTEPHAVFALSERSKIPTEALNSVNYGLYENHTPSEEQAHGRSTQDAFTKETSQWFPKMSKEDLQNHGKNLMSMYVRMHGDKKISGVTYQDAITAGMKHVGSLMSHRDVMNLIDQTKQPDIRQSIFEEAVKNGVGGDQTYSKYIKDNEEQLFKSVKESTRGEGDSIAARLEPALKSPHITDEVGAKVNQMFQDNPANMKKSVVNMMKNKSTPAKTVAELSSRLLKNHEGGYMDLDSRTSADIAIEAMQHPNISESDLVGMFNVSQEKYPKYFAPNGKFNPALTNPTHGGKLFRSMPIEVPKEVPGVESASAVKSVSLQHKAYKRMQDVMGLIPAEGISWADFKRKHPSEEKTLPQEIKSVFMAGNNKPVMPEDFANGLRNLDDASKKFHMTYSAWTSDLQKHRKDSAPNLVVQVNNSEESEKALSSDPKLWSLYQKLLTQANGISGDTIGLHPTTPHLVSWSRVDTDQGGDAWVIEEHQSDFAQKFRKNLKTLLQKFPSGTTINGHHVTAEDMAGYAKTIDKHLEDWSEASMQAVIENAKAHGVKKLFMHGAELRSHMSGGTSKLTYNREAWDNKNTRGMMSGFRKIYEETPIKHGFKECDYTDYPRHSTEFLNRVKKEKLSTKCWQMNLDQSPKKARKKTT
jgi:hypothetical protein